MNYSEISRCRLSGKPVTPVLSLGKMALSGVFPKQPGAITFGPIDLVYCKHSGLVQLKQTYDLGEMYGDNYGYRSGLNKGMATHLRDVAASLQALRPLKEGDTVLDIGGNDGTLIKAYDGKLIRVVVDPTVNKWSRHYLGTDICTLPEFWPCPWKYPKAAIITSMSCLYDLPDPQAFVDGVAAQLAPDGIWHSEQSYLPAMIAANSYDTICHEHIEYYTFKVIDRMLHDAGLKVIQVQRNHTNGGSIAITAAHVESSYVPDEASIQRIQHEESLFNHDPVGVLKEFESRMMWHRRQLRNKIQRYKDDGKVVAGLGASTKGNILLQYCGFTSRDIEFIIDVNPDKKDCYTPGSLIPIVNEDMGRKLKPDVLLVLPWHFKQGIIEREQEFLNRGGTLLFPLPHIEEVKK